MGKLRPGLVTVGIVVSQRDAEELERYREEQGFRSPATAGGAVVSAWAAGRRHGRRESSLKPREGTERGQSESEESRSLKPQHMRGKTDEPEPVNLETWEELQGELVAIAFQDSNWVLILRTFSGPVATVLVPVDSPTDLPKSMKRPPAAGDLIAVLRTDIPDKPYVLRFLASPRRRGRRKDEASPSGPTG